MKRSSEQKVECESSQRQPAGLVAVLLDIAAEHGDRLDAAIDLADFDSSAAERALLQIVLDRSGGNDLADAAGHSLWQMWQRAGKNDASAVARMHAEARKFFR